MKNCSIDGCGRGVLGRGLCSMHYKRLMRHGSPDSYVFMKGPLKERFFSKLVRGDQADCWNWTSTLNNKGYGTIFSGEKNVLAHRVSYEIHTGEIPAGMNILHSCDNPACVNPSHLRAGTQSENIKEGYARGRPIGRRANMAAKA